MTNFRAPSHQEEVLLNSIDKEELVRFNEIMAKEVRLSGSPEELRAFEYAQALLNEFGYQTELLFNEAYISLPGQASLRVGEHDYSCITHSMGTSVQGLDANIVYVKGGKSEDLAADVLEGSVLLVDGLAVPAVVKNATEAGAKSIIFINTAYTHEMIVSPVWGHPVPETADLLPKIPVVSVNLEDGNHIKEQLQAGDSHCVISTEVDTGFRPIPTLTAELKGTDESDKFVLFSGHIDSWHYGAMDNGSANALMLEAARIFAENRDSLKRSLRLAFWSGHSHGRYAGSTWYCDTHWEDMTDNCVVHVNVDSVGGIGSTVLTEANCMKETSKAARDAIGYVTGQAFEGARFGRAGDQSFWGTGTPSLFMGLSEQPLSDNLTSKAFAHLFGGGKSGGFGWWWHTTEDTLDKIDPDALVRDTKVYMLVLNRFLVDPVYPISQLAAVQDIRQSLEVWQTVAGEHVDLNQAIRTISNLEEQVTVFQSRLNEISGDKEKEQAANEAIMELSRILVPLNYVRGSVYDHDLALSQPAVPGLAGINDLVGLEPQSAEYRYVKTAVLRRVNEVNYALKRALAVASRATVQLTA
jgi:hypothetical protein